MKLEEQVCSFELAKRLKELGVKQESFCYWAEPLYFGRNTPMVQAEYPAGYTARTHIASAFTVAELGEMLPPRLQLNGSCDWWSAKEGDKWECKYRDYASADQLAPTEADARADMLIYLLENNHLETVDVTGEKCL